MSIVNQTQEQDVVANTPLEDIDVSRPELFSDDTWRPWFARLREEAPVHYLADSANGPFWSVTSHDLIKEIDTNHQVFSSEVGGFPLLRLKRSSLRNCRVRVSSNSINPGMVRSARRSHPLLHRRTLPSWSRLFESV
jgi:cytochrome P450